MSDEHQTAETITYRKPWRENLACRWVGKCVRVAGIKIRYKPRKQLLSMLSGAGMDLAESYRCGAEEAQYEIVRRLAELQSKTSTITDLEQAANE